MAAVATFCGYNADGDQTMRTVNGQSWTLAYDYDDQLTGVTGTGEGVATAGYGLDALGRPAVRRGLDAALARLAPEPCSFLLRRHAGGEAARDIAADAGRTAHAVEACLTRTHGRLRALLGRSGVLETDLRFVSAPAPAGGSASVVGQR